MTKIRGRDQKNLNFHVFFSSTLIGKNDSIRVERHKLLLVISKEQANEKDRENYGAGHASGTVVRDAPEILYSSRPPHTKMTVVCTAKLPQIIIL